MHLGALGVVRVRVRVRVGVRVRCTLTPLAWSVTLLPRGARAVTMPTFRLVAPHTTYVRGRGRVRV